MFTHVFYLQLEEDVNIVIFALNTEAGFEDDCFHQAPDTLSRLLKLEQGLRDQILDDARKIKRMR